MRNFGLTHALAAILVAFWILAGIAWRRSYNDEQDRVATARRQVNEFQELVGRYVQQTGRVPGTLEEVTRAFDSSISVEDPWSAQPDRPQYYLLRPAVNNGARRQSVISLGADGMFGGDGFGADIIADPQ